MGIEYQCLQGSLDVEIDEIAYDSRKAGPGALFVCIKGMEADGHQYAKEAIEKGAVAILCSQPLSFENKVTVIGTENSRRALAQVSATFYDFPSKDLYLIGVTGTKGKTTTTYMIKEILEEAGMKTGLMGTIVIDTGCRTLESWQTTPESLEIQKLFREMADCGCKAVVMEVSSQALKLERVYGMHFDIGILTNVEEDHIGQREHRNFDEYINCKAKLFQMCTKAIINIDEPNKELVLQNHTCREVIFYGFDENADFYVSDFDYVKIPGKLAVEFQVKGRYNINLVVCAAGKFTAYNALAAMAVGKELNVPTSCLQRALKRVSVPGRQEMFSIDYDKIIMVDYAHNGTALTCLLQALRQYEPKKLTCLFGCGGQRDRNRRFNMGEAAAKYADFSVITSDNPRNESPSSIISDIIIKMESFGGKYCVIEDRRQAIDFATKNCKPGEIVVIAGKGHENYQIIGEKKVHFDDREEVLASIEKVKDEQNYNRRS